ncbi:MAG: DUF3592 domain-containing protein [Gammaproteobacteria bacterium]|nr:MAG: DUF3592 domain-containing protein [Gammaproteobacteria bacterium]
MPKTQKGFSTFLFLFGSVFFCVGTGIGIFVVLPDLRDWQQMKEWIPHQANIINVRLDESRGDDSTTYSVRATYVYTFEGKKFQNNRVTITGGSDNLGDYHHKMYRRLKKQYDDEEPIRIWLDSASPKNSVIDRDMRWGMFAFMGLFVFLFGGIGLVIMIVAIFSGKKDKNYQRIMNGETPKIRSNAMGKFIGAWLFSIIWNAIAAPASYFAYQQYLEKDEPLLLLMLIFIAAGIWLLFYAIRSTFEFVKFGRLELIPDPYPGSLGGNVGGTIKLNEEFDPSIKYKLVLSCVHIYYTSGGRNNSRTKHEELVWQREGFAKSESLDSYAKRGATKLEFCFDIPDNLPESSEGSDYHEWKLELTADLPGIDLEREFIIPVEKGVRKSSVNIQDAQVVLDAAEQEISESFLQISDTLDGIQFYYPPLKGGALYIFKLVTGLAFVGFLSWIGFSAASRVEEVSLFIMFFVAIFGLIVALGIGFSIYQLLHTLMVSIEGGKLISVSRVLFPIKISEIAVHEIRKVKKSRSMQMGNQGKTPVAYYKIEAFGDRGERVCVARGVKGEQLADAIIAKIKSYI